MRAAVEEVHRSLGFPWTSIWLVSPGEEPRLGFAVGRAGLRELPTVIPPQVLSCARTGKPVKNEVAGMMAFPIETPLSGLVGVLYLQGRIWNVDEQAFVDAVVRQTGLTLEAAKMHDHAASERQKSEAILERIADGVVVTDPSGTIVQSNPAARIILGTSKDPAGSTCASVMKLHAGERALDCSEGCALLRAIREITLDGGVPGSVEVWRAVADGRRQPLLADVAEVSDADGNARLLVHSLRDITKLKQADEAKTLFLATASHELKTPLTVIGGFAQTLLTHSPSMSGPMRTEALAAIDRRARELTSIVNRLLLSSRIEAGRVDLTRGAVDVGTIVTERARALGTVRSRRIDVSVGDELPTVLGDADALATIVDHLIDNAIKYSPDGEPVEISVRLDDAHVRMDVTDHGIGMDADAVARCTEKFWQAESTDVRRFGGTGIGLYIVRSLVEGMGGRLSVSSEPGAGSTFAIMLRTHGAPHLPVPEAHDPGLGEPSVIKEFMKQIGVPGRRR